VNQKSIVFLLDVDNTLLDNDRIKADMARGIEALVGAKRAPRFWELYEKVRAEKDYVDLPTTVQRWADENGDSETGRRVEEMLEKFPFTEYLYPRVMETLEYLNTLGTTVILSDGDPIFQPLKIRNSRLERAVHGRVLVYVHKEEKLPEVFKLYPADHYVVVDDKPRILAALERSCPTTFTTILVLQGKYASDTSYAPEPDRVLPSFESLRELGYEDFLTDSKAS
jgi:FMN phosphatase YigB (HAD superfamily)